MKHLLSLATVAVLAACANADATPDSSAASEPDATVAQSAMASPAGSDAAAAQTADRELPAVVVFKTATCGCCAGWVEHMREAGFEVDARDVANLMSVKVDAGVPGDMITCHTAIVDGYVVEGHVPADQVKRMLDERPDVAGIAVPGMPIGSPGMEGPNAQPYDVVSWTRDGEQAVYAEIDPR